MARLVFTICFSSLSSYLTSWNPLWQRAGSFSIGILVKSFLNVGRISWSFYDAIIPCSGNVWKNGVLIFRLFFLSFFQCVCRGYHLKKIQENNQAEIMEVVAEEARSSYPPEIVVELKSESTEDMEANVARIVEWINAWRRDHGQES